MEISPQSILFESKPNQVKLEEVVPQTLFILNCYEKQPKHLSVRPGLSPQNHGPSGTFAYSFSQYLLNFDCLPGTVLGTRE